MFFGMLLMISTYYYYSCMNIGLVSRIAYVIRHIQLYWYRRLLIPYLYSFSSCSLADKNTRLAIMVLFHSLYVVTSNTYTSSRTSIEVAHRFPLCLAFFVPQNLSSSCVRPAIEYGNSNTIFGQGGLEVSMVSLHVSIQNYPAHRKG